MSKGKAASQAGHAFLDSFLTAPADSIAAYQASGGTKIVLSISDERALCDLYHKARMARLPCAMVVESEHIHPPDFDGSPIVTAVGIGPLPRSEASQITRNLSLL